MSTESNDNPTPRIRIEDLPVEQPLSEEEQAATFGAGRGQLGLEALEAREVMAAALMASLTAGVLRIEGTPNAEIIRVVQSTDRLSVSGINIQSGSAQLASVSTSAVNRIEIASLGGADSVFVDLGNQPLKVPLALTTGAAGDWFSDSVSHISQTVSTDVVKLLRGGDGTVFQFQTDGWLSVNGKHALSGVKDLALGEGSTPYFLQQNGTLSKFPAGGIWLADSLQRVDAATLKSKLQGLDPTTLQVAVNLIDLPTLAVGMTRVDAPTLQKIVNVIDPARVDSVLSQLDQATRDLARSYMPSVENLIRMPLEGLRPALAGLSPPWLKYVVEHLDGTTLKNALQQMDVTTLPNAVNTIDLPTLAAGLPRVDGPTLGNILKVIDPPQLAAVFARLDPGTQQAVRDRAVTPYTRMTREQLKPALETLSPGWLRFVVERVDGATLNNALEVVNVNTLGVAVNSIDLPTLSAGLVRVDSPTLTNVTKVIDPSRLASIMPMLDGATQEALRNRVIAPYTTMTREQLTPALAALSQGWLKFIVERVDGGTLKNALERMDLVTLQRALNTIDFPTLAAGLPRVDGGTLGNSIPVIEPARLASVMPMLDAATQQAVHSRAVAPYVAMTREQLKPALEALDSGWLTFVLQRVDGTTLRNALEVVDEKTLRSAVGSIDLPTLAAGLPRVGGSTLTVIVQVIDPTRLDAVIPMLDAATQQTVRDRMPSIDGFIRMTREQLKPALENLSPGWLARVLTRLDAATLENALEVMSLNTLRAAVNGIDLPTLVACLPRVDAPTLDNIVQVIEPARLIAVMSLLDSATQAAVRSRMLSADVCQPLHYGEAGGTLFFLEGGFLHRVAGTSGAVEKVTPDRVGSFGVAGDGVYYLLESVGRLVKQGTNSASGTEVSYQEAEGKLFFLDGGHLWAFNHTSNSVVDFNNGGSVQAFGVNSGGVYLWETNGTLFRRNFDGSQGAGALGKNQLVDGRLLFLDAGRLWALKPNGNTLVDFNNGVGVRAFATNAGGVYLWENYGSLPLTRRNFDGGLGAVLTYQRTEGKLFFRDTDRTLYVLNTVSGTVTNFDPGSTVSDFVVHGDKVYILEADGARVLLRRELDGTGRMVLDYKQAGSKLYFLDADSVIRVLDVSTASISNTVNGVTISGAIASEWLAAGGPTGALGLPTSSEGGVLHFEGGDISSDSGGLSVVKTVSVPGIGDVQLNGHLDDNGRYVFTATVNINVAGFSVDGAEVELAEGQVHVSFTLNVPEIGDVQFEAGYDSDGSWYVGGKYPGPIQVGPVTLRDLNFRVTESYLELGCDHATLASIPQLVDADLMARIYFDGRFIANIDADILTLGPFSLGQADVTLTNFNPDNNSRIPLTLSVNGSVSIPGMGELANLHGVINANGDYFLEAKRDISLGGFSLSQGVFRLDKATGLTVVSTLGIPRVGAVSNMTGWIDPQGNFFLMASHSFDVGEYSLANCEFRLGNTGLTFSGNDRVSGISVSGSIDSAGNVSLHVNGGYVGTVIGGALDRAANSDEGQKILSGLEELSQGKLPKIFG